MMNIAGFVLILLACFMGSLALQERIDDNRQNGNFNNVKSFYSDNEIKYYVGCGQYFKGPVKTPIQDKDDKIIIYKIDNDKLKISKSLCNIQELNQDIINQVARGNLPIK